MNLMFATKALLEELIRMRSNGIDRISMKEATLRELEALLQPESESINTLNEKLHDLVEEAVPVKMDSLTHAVAESIPISQGKSSKSVKEPTAVFPESPSFELPTGSKREQWEWLQKKIAACETCNDELNPNGKVVLGEGDLNADLFLCGEAPGPDEEVAGLPFVGPAGDLLIKILNAMGLQREEVYLCNILNWRPKHNQAYGNRPPRPEEIDFCLPYFHAQLDIVQPKIVVALGKTATDGLLGHEPKRRLSHVRGQWHESSGIPLMVTYHPSYLLHNPSKTSKRKVWEDFLLVMEKLQMPITEKQRGFFL